LTLNHGPNFHFDFGFFTASCDFITCTSD